ncbi:unnamed protein product, partial [Ectocarpus sp. 12 AP-2014]
ERTGARGVLWRGRGRRTCIRVQSRQQKSLVFRFSSEQKQTIYRSLHCHAWVRLPSKEWLGVPDVQFTVTCSSLRGSLSNLYCYRSYMMHNKRNEDRSGITVLSYL